MVKSDKIRSIRPGLIVSMMAVVLCYSIGAPALASTTTAASGANPSFGMYGPHTVWSDMGNVGSVTGEVTLAVTGTVGICGAYVALVDAKTGKEYYNTTSDANGSYQIVGINATYSSTLHEGPDGTTGSYNAGMNVYKIYAAKMPYGDGYSAAFGIDANRSVTTTTSVVIVTKPQNIALTAGKSHIVANGTDHTAITAYAYDALGNPVADGYQITFHLDAAKKGMGQFAAAGSSVPKGSADITATVVNGTATVEFGWMTKVNKNATITASVSGVPTAVNGTITLHSVHR